MAHTPGPWKVIVEPNELHVCREGFSDPFLSFVQLVNPTFRGTVGTGTESHANARLIAAAPDLLAALKLAAQCVNTKLMVYSQVTHGDRVYVADVINAAIAKAEGK